MPKTKHKNIESIGEEKIINIDIEDKEIDPEVPIEDEEDATTEEDAILDDEEINPFGDKWEEQLYLLSNYNLYKSLFTYT